MVLWHSLISSIAFTSFQVHTKNAHRSLHIPKGTNPKKNVMKDPGSFDTWDKTLGTPNPKFKDYLTIKSINKRMDLYMDLFKKTTQQPSGTCPAVSHSCSRMGPSVLSRISPFTWATQNDKASPLTGKDTAIADVCNNIVYMLLFWILECIPYIYSTVINNGFSKRTHHISSSPYENNIKDLLDSRWSNQD